MAGGGAAYKGYKDLGNGVSQALQNFTGIQAQKNAAKKLADERAGVRLDESVKAYEDAFDMDKIKVKMSDMKNAGAISMDYGKAVLSQVVAAKRLGAAAVQSGNKEEAAKQQAIYDSHVANVDLVNQVTTQGNTALAEFFKNSDKHLIQDETHKMYGGIAKNNYMLIPTKDGSLRLMVGIDRDGDGELDDGERAAAKGAMAKAKADGDAFKKDGYKEGDFDIVEADAQMLFQGAYKGFNKVQMVGDEGLAGQLASGVGLTKQDELGNYVTTRKFIDEKGLAALRQGAKGLLNDPQNLANAAVYSQIYRKKKPGESNYIKKKREDYTDVELKTIEDNLVKAALAQYEVETSYKSALTTEEDKAFNKNVAKAKLNGGKQPKVMTVEPRKDKVGGANGFSVNMGDSKFTITKEKDVIKGDKETEESFQRRSHLNRLFGVDEQEITFETVIMKKDGTFVLKNQGKELEIHPDLRGWVANKFKYSTVDAFVADIKKKGQRGATPKEETPKKGEKVTPKSNPTVRGNPTGFGANTKEKE